MAEATKDTIYIDIDDDITGIIDKVSGSKHKIVALVLPKRATSLQSIVNMKLLKRSGQVQKKQIVLITSEASILPLAGAVKLHVAKTLQTKPTIPPAPDVPSDEVAADDAIADDIDDGDVPDVDKSKSVSELAGKGAKPEPAETIEIDDDTPVEDEPKAKAGKGDKKLKIPNFEKFRLKILLGGTVLLGLIIFWYFANFVMPRAKVTIFTDNVSVNADVSLTLDTDAQAIDPATAVVPAVTKTVKKTDSEKVTATGKKDVGDKATGTVSLKLVDCSKDSVTIPAGTIVTNGNQGFVTQSGITFNSVKIGNSCKNDSFPAFTTGTVNVTAQNPGDVYNISGGRTFTVAGFSNVSGYDSSAMAGGTSKQVTVVSADDITTALDALKDKSKDAASTDLEGQFKDDNLYPIAETLASSKPVTTPSPAVGTEASEVTVTAVTTYTMLGAKRDDLKAIIVNSVKDKIDRSKQKISNDGLNDAIIKVTDKKSDTNQKVSIQTVVGTGAQEDKDALKKEITGKKKGDVQAIINARPGVKSVDVSFSPFWVYKTPKNPNKITIEYKQATDEQDNQ